MTKLVQPNVLRAYQSGEQYAINELVLYNSVPAYTNTALAQGVAGTAGNFTNIGSNTFSDSLFRIQDNANATKQLAFEVSGIATGTTRTITMSDANVDLGASTSSTLASGAFVYATGMGSVVKTITGDGATFNVDALEQNPAHSVTIRNGDSSYPYNALHTFQFVSAKVGGIGSGFTDAQGFGLQDATYINSLSTLTITLQPNESMEVRYLGSGGGFTSVFSMQRNLVGLVAIPASTSDFTLYHERRHSLPHAYAGVLNLKLPITHRIGTSITLEDVVGTSASTITAINITPMGSQTVFALASVDIKNFIDNGCTVKLVLQSSNNWVYNVQYSKVVRGNTLGVRNTVGTLTSLNVVAATVDRVVTFPNADINLGNLSSVATTDSHTLSGTRTRIVGGYLNTVSGTDNAAINCYATNLGASATSVTAISCSGVAVTRTTTKAFLAGCSNIILRPEAPHNNGLVALGVAYKTDAFAEFPQWTGHTIIGTEDGIHACITVYGNNPAAGNVNLTSSTGVKPLATTGNLNYTKGVQHIIHLVGQNNDVTPNKVVTVAYKVVSYATGSGIALGAVQTIEPLFDAVGTPATPTVTISITAYDRLNINVASADAMYWAARVDSYFA